jgi:hypothetical protein
LRKKPSKLTHSLCSSTNQQGFWFKCDKSCNNEGTQVRRQGGGDLPRPKSEKLHMFLFFLPLTGKILWNSPLRNFFFLHFPNSSSRNFTLAPALIATIILAVLIVF